MISRIAQKRSTRRWKIIAWNMRILEEICQAGIAGDARSKSDRGAGAGNRHVQLRKEQGRARITGEFYVNAIHVMEGARAG